jgi:hypothetical protein
VWKTSPTEPADNQSQISPHFPPDAKGNEEFEQPEAIWMLCCMLPDNVDNPNIKQVYKELKGLDLFDI